MSKRRDAHANWYATPFEQRLDMMMEHGSSGRKFAGRVVQLVTASTGLDDFEWGVTLFADDLDVVKDVVYTMRFDRGSALYGEFGKFFVGYLDDVDSTWSDGWSRGSLRMGSSCGRRPPRRSRNASNQARVRSPVVVESSTSP
jgi:hypothetical protein